jgi:hypothetical protein
VRADEKLTAFLVTVNSQERGSLLFAGARGFRPVLAAIHKNYFGGIPLGFIRLGMNPGYKGTMHIQSRYILTIATLAFALASGLSNVSADELKEAKVTQVIQDVRVLPSNASPRPAAVNDNVHQGTAVQTGVQSRSELTFKDQTITRLGEKTIFSVGEGPRNIDLGSGQFLLYAPKKAGGAKVKMGPVTAAITG